MSFYYAQINEENVCICVSELSSDMSEHSNLLRIHFLDSSLLGKKWNGTDWEEIQPSQEEEPT